MSVCVLAKGLTPARLPLHNWNEDPVGGLKCKGSVLWSVQKNHEASTAGQGEWLDIIANEGHPSFDLSSIKKVKLIPTDNG